MAVAAARLVPDPAMSSHDITIAGYLAVLLAAVVLQVLAARTPGRRSRRSATVLTRTMRSRTGRVGVLVAWAWLGPALLRPVAWRQAKG